MIQPAIRASDRMAGTVPAPPTPVIDRATARAIVTDGIERYIAERHARVDAFVDRHFTLRGTLRLHKVAVGYDLLRAPANVALGFAAFGKQVAAAGLKAAGRTEAARALNRRNLFLETAVGREIRWRVMTELLELPLTEGQRRSDEDALVKTILADPRLTAHFAETLAAVGRRSDDAAFRERLLDAMMVYIGCRSAAADMTSSILAAAAGMGAYQQFTPGMTTLSASVAATIAHKSAVAGFTLGPWAGGIYYSMFKAATPPLLYAGVFTSLMLPLAALTAFAGVATDPLQRRMGLHQRRLHRLIDSLDGALTGREAEFSVRDHYAARLLDVIDWSMMLLRLAR